MKDRIYLIADRTGLRDSRKSKPSLQGGQIAVLLELEIPASYFDRFVPLVKVTLPETADLVSSDVIVAVDGVVIPSVIEETDHAQGKGVATDQSG